jgi:hypothetical protein
VLRQDARKLRVVPGEVEEPKRLAADLVAVAGPRHVAFVQVPVGDVERVRAQHVVSIEGRYEVEQPLVDEHPVLEVDQAVAPKPLAPPLEKRPRVGADTDEAEVEDPCVGDVVRRGLPAVLGQRVQRVRGQHDAVLRGQRLELVERREDLDVRVEVADGLAALEQMEEERGLDRRGELGRVVDRRHQAKLPRLERELGGDDELERLGRGVELAADLGVDDEDDQPARVVLGKRAREDARIGEVVPRDDGGDGHSSEPPRSELGPERSSSSPSLRLTRRWSAASWRSSPWSASSSATSAVVVARWCSV